MKRDLHVKKTSEVNLGFQIAPMVDVVFVIMLFFMVMAGAVKVEKRHFTNLPGIPPKDPVPLQAEIFIRVDDDGQVYLNEDPLDSPEVRSLSELANNLFQLRESSDTSKSDVLVTIDADERTPYQRIIDVLDALSLARIENVSFTTAALE